MSSKINSRILYRLFFAFFKVIKRYINEFLLVCHFHVFLFFTFGCTNLTFLYIFYSVVLMVNGKKNVHSFIKNTNKKYNSNIKNTFRRGNLNALKCEELKI